MTNVLISLSFFSHHLSYTEVVADPMQQPDEWIRDVPSAAVGEEPQAKPEALCKPQCAAQFTSFVVHILTGECFKCNHH